MSYLKDSENCCSCLTLKDFKLTEDDFYDPTDEISPVTYMKLVLNSPTSQSNLRIKESNCFKRHIDECIDYIRKEIDIKSVYFFDSFTTAKDSKKDISEVVKNASHTFVYMYLSSSFCEDFYSGIRNALAHGNVMKKGKYYYLYALAGKEKQKSEFEKNIKFMLKIKSLTNLDAFITGFEMFNKKKGKDKLYY